MLRLAAVGYCNAAVLGGGFPHRPGAAHLPNWRRDAARTRRRGRLRYGRTSVLDQAGEGTAVGPQKKQGQDGNDYSHRQGAVVEENVVVYFDSLTANAATRRPRISPVALSASFGATSGGSWPACAMTPL
jgi:hypothetical protein